jgi:hypothetical protein
MKEREKQMNLIQILTDYTNYDWQFDETGVIAVWVEDGQSLGVNAWFDLETNDGTIVLMNEIVSDYYRIQKHQYNRLAIATEYAQFSASDHFGILGTAEQFEAYAVAMEVIGGEPGFAGTEDGIVLTIGDPWVWVEWNGERYDLFQDGCHRYAATKDGLLRAYNKLVKEVQAFSAVKIQQQLQKSQN